MLFEEQEVMLACTQCHEKVAKSTLKYNSTGDFLICNGCYTKEHTSVEELPSLATERQSFNSLHASMERIDYECTSCHYEFSRKPTQRVSGCPYCARKSVKTKTPMSSPQKASKEDSMFWDVDLLFD